MRVENYHSYYQDESYCQDEFAYGLIKKITCPQESNEITIEIIGYPKWIVDLSWRNLVMVNMKMVKNNIHHLLYK